jgi:enamine deaminase RidA (YjgF/YER057c/UK114 family)
MAAGLGGWNDEWEVPVPLADEIAQAFRNVERTLAGGGCGPGAWDRGEFISFRIPRSGQPDHDRALPSRYANNTPPWIALGVATVPTEHARVEIRVTAILPD